MKEHRRVEYRHMSGGLPQMLRDTKPNSRVSSSGELAVLKAHIQKNITVFQRLRDK